MNRSLAAVLAFFVPLVVVSISPPFIPPAAASGEPSPQGFLRIRGGLVFPDRDGEPGPGWLAGGALGFPLTPSVSLSANYDHMYLDVPGSRSSVNPLTIQLELAAPYRHRVSPRAEFGAGIYDFGFRDFPVVSPLRSFEAVGTRSREVPFGMNFGGGLSVPLWARTMFDLDLRYHQTMGNNSLVMGTIGAGLTYRLGSP